MKVICENLPYSRQKCVAAIGTFDGIHLGHQFILNRVKETARNLSVSSLLITFDIPPQIILNKDFDGCITNLEEKKEVIKSLGIDYLWFLAARSRLLKLSGEKFISYILDYFDIKKIIVGEDFRFGYKGEADTHNLKQWGHRFGFEVDVLKKKTISGRVISSSLIRKLIKSGDFYKVKKFLGRSFVSTGKVHRGLGYGKTLGFPTANIYVFDHDIPLSGVYAAFAQIGKQRYLSAVNIGVKPTMVESGEKVLEVHLINTRKSLLGKTIKVVFLEKIRAEKKFSSPMELKRAIAEDVSYIIRKFQ